MTVKFSHLTSSWTFECIYGCYEFDFEGEHEATEAFLAHSCQSAFAEPCS
jgi:hypothetical protein